VSDRKSRHSRKDTLPPWTKPSAISSLTGSPLFSHSSSGQVRRGPRTPRHLSGSFARIARADPVLRPGHRIPPYPAAAGPAFSSVSSRRRRSYWL
jgi:hypothetical protein